MWEEILAAFHQAFDAFNRRDRASWLAWCDPQLENVPPRDWPESRPVRGSEAVWDFFVEGNEEWEEGAFEVSELIEAGDDRVVAHVQREVKGKVSGVTVPWQYWQVSTWRDGKVVRFEWFTERGQALKAAGLSE